MTRLVFFLWISAGNKLSADDMKGKLYPVGSYVAERNRAANVC